MNQLNGTSIIRFYDIANITTPVELDHLTITRSRVGDTAGAVALIFLGNSWLVSVANWDAARLDFYISNSPDLRNATTRFSATPRWSWSKATNGLGTGPIDRQISWSSLPLATMRPSGLKTTDQWAVAF